MSETIITTRDVKNRLDELQKKYGFSSEEFRNNPEVRNRVSNEDEFEWEAFLEHASILHEQEQELHREYLAHGIRVSSPVTDKFEVATKLAA